MIVFDLKCSNAHVFEAWFGKSADYEDQRARGLLVCPMCGDGEVGKAVMAPNVGAKSNQLAAAPSVSSAPANAPTPDPKTVMAMLAQVQAKMLEGSKYVGASFTEKARAMHVGEVEAAPIHGQATVEQAKELIEEGIAIAPLPLPVVPPEQQN